MIQTVDSLFGGSANASGVFQSSPLQPCTALYGALKVVATVSGPSARWTVLVGGIAKAFPRGERVDVPILVQPNQAVVIQITGASPNANVNGSLTGLGATTLPEIAPLVALVPNAVTLDTLGNQQQIDEFLQQPGVVVTNRSYPLYPGTQSVRVQVNQNSLSVTFTNLSIVGVATGNVYVFPSSGNGTGGFDEWFKPSLADVAAGFLFSLNTTGSVNPVEVILTADLSMNFVIAALTGAGTSSGDPVLVENTSAAPWQAPQSKVYVEVSTGVFPVAVVAGIVGKTIYVHGWELETDGAAAPRFTVLYDTTNGNPAGRFAKLTTASGQVVGSGGGGTLPSGAGISMTSGAIAGEFTSAIVWYNQV